MHIGDLKKRFASASRRAKYWSGLPTFSKGAGFSATRVARERLATRGSSHEQEYEIAMCDMLALADQIEAAGGIRPRVTDFKASYNS